MNKGTFTGRLIGDPTYRDVAGVKAGTFTISVRTRGKDENGYPNSFLLKCNVWRKLAELSESFGVHKGQTIAVCGMVDVETFVSKKTGEKGFNVTLDVDDIDFLKSVNGGSIGETGAPAPSAEAVQTNATYTVVDEAPPF